MSFLFKPDRKLASVIMAAFTEFEAPQQISTGFASWLRYCTDGCQPNFARRLAVSSAAALYTFLRALAPPKGILPGATFTLRHSLAFSYIGITARHSSSGRQPNCGVQ